MSTDNKLIIGISGLIGSGKDTIADCLVNFHGFRKESWAGHLKDIVSVVFGWDRTMLEGRTTNSREWREQPDKWWSERLGRTITPRLVLQEWGTEVCRHAFHDDIWIASLENKLRQSKDSIVISDCRFVNEIATIRKLGGITIRVVRGNKPAWYDIAMTDPSMMKVMYPEVHISEYSLIGVTHDYTIENNDSMDVLHKRISDLLRYPRPAK